ncbi:GNAT family N-acetyltransferase [Kitasatospora sp. NPDC048365]|uniref:GNAT family N-acetyltransferase n=1 Tax=Kitasatospora sp. NPDC048365 TaxID=3364050 RepID=UPI003722710A
MLHGEKVGLRARHDEDVPVLLDELHGDVVTRTRGDDRPWRPVAPGATTGNPFRVDDLPEDVVCFSAVDLASGELLGEAVLWGIDPHKRSAHLGLALRPAHRGKGLGTDVVRVLCDYGFAVRGLNRLQVETLADNTPMIKAAERAGFTVEGTLRSSTWVYGGFADETILGLLAAEWTR